MMRARKWLTWLVVLLLLCLIPAAGGAANDETTASLALGQQSRREQGCQCFSDDVFHGNLL